MARPSDKDPGLIDMIRSVVLNEIQDEEGAADWLNTNFNDPVVTALFAAALKKTWGVPDSWVVERFVFGDTPVDQVVADLEEFTGEDDLSAKVGRIANDIASEIVQRRRESLGQKFGQDSEVE